MQFDGLCGDWLRVFGFADARNGDRKGAIQAVEQECVGVPFAEGKVQVGKRCYFIEGDHNGHLRTLMFL
jgi:hypothetical protein